MSKILDVDPRTLLLPTPRQDGADPLKLQRQIARYGTSTVGMDPPWVEEDLDGRLRLINGTTRAVRVAKLLPGTTIRVVVTDTRKRPFTTRKTVADVLN